MDEKKCLILSPDLDHFKVPKLLYTLSYDPASHRGLQAMANLNELMNGAERGSQPLTLRQRSMYGGFAVNRIGGGKNIPCHDLVYKIPWAMYETHGFPQVVAFFNSDERIDRMIALDVMKYILRISTLRVILLKHEPELVSKLLSMITADFYVRAVVLNVLEVLVSHVSSHAEMHRHGAVDRLRAHLQSPAFYSSAGPNAYLNVCSDYVESLVRFFLFFFCFAFFFIWSVSQTVAEGQG